MLIDTRVIDVTGGEVTREVTVSWTWDFGAFYRMNPEAIQVSTSEVLGVGKINLPVCEIYPVQ